jgi:xanthine/uracil permease
MPIADGPAGIWLGIFVIMGQMAIAQATDQTLTLRLLEGGMLITGLTVLLIGLLGWMQRMLKLFTPLVTGVNLILLTVQLSGTLLKGMFGVSDTSATLHPFNVAIAFGVFLLVLACSVWGKGLLKNYGVLIGVMVGWVVYALHNGLGSLPKTDTIVSAPKVFAWGIPRLDAGIIVTSVIVAFVLISNVIASVSAMQQVLSTEEKPKSLDRGGMFAGVANILSSLFSTIGVVPLSISAGFVRLTGQRRMAPYFIACAALIMVAFIPSVYSFLSLLPGQVAYAAMLASFAQMIGIGLVSILRVPLDDRRLTILGLSLSFGTGVMFLPQNMFSALPSIFQYLFSNGLLVGMMVALLMEQLWRVKPAGLEAKESK